MKRSFGLVLAFGLLSGPCGEFGGGGNATSGGEWPGAIGRQDSAEL